MTKTFRAALLAALAIGAPLAASTAASATDYATGAKAQHVGRTAHVKNLGYGQRLNVRATPGVYSTRINSIPANAYGVAVKRCTVSRDGRAYDWCKVDFRGCKGWVAARFLAIH